MANKYKRLVSSALGRMIQYKIEYGIEKMYDAFENVWHPFHNGQVKSTATVKFDDNTEFTIPLPPEIVRQVINKRFRLIIEVEKD